MSRDVYSGDDALNGLTSEPDGTFAAEFLIEADDDVDVTCRVANVLRLANRAMTRGSLVNERGKSTTIRVEMEGLSLAAVENLLRKLSQLTCVSESQVRVTDSAPGVAIRVLRMTEQGIVSNACPAQPP